MRVLHLALGATVGLACAHEPTTTSASESSLAGAPAEPGRPMGDRSRAFAAWESSWVSLGPPEQSPQGEVRGKVTAIVPGTVEVPGSVRIEAADGTAVELALSGPGTLVLAVDDEVAVTWSVRPVGREIFDESIAVLDRDRRVIYARGSAFEAASLAPGWSAQSKAVAERGKRWMGRGAREESRWVVVALGEATAVVKESDPTRRLATAHGEYAVSASAISWTRGGRPSGASSYERFALVRLPARPRA
jgi:hypothetical protein